MKFNVTCLPLLSLTLCSALGLAQNALPSGTVLPARLNTSLSTKKVRAGQEISARIMQDVPLPSGQKIPEGAKIVGHVVQVTPANAGHPGTVAIRFDSLRFAHRTIPVTTSLRALASLSEVEGAETPKTGPDRGTPARWASRILVGGEAYYGDGGPVTRGPDTVGQGLVDGILASVSAPRGSRCAGAPHMADPQALWVFSSDVCGAYGFENLEITHAGYHSPRGDIQLTAEKGNLEVGSGSGMLLQVSPSSN
jgi:hypothetical protein